jgi:TRAP-type C4-dicarboxylate transport system permease small subunit
MKRYLALVDGLCDLAGGLAAVTMALLFILGLIEMTLRGAAGISLSFAVEYAGYLLILSLFLGSGWTLRQGGHIRVSLLSERLGPAARHALDLTATLAGFAVAVFISYALLRFGWGTWTRGTLSYFPSATPLGFPQLLLALGPTILALAFSARLIRLLRREPGDLGHPATE